MTMLMDPATVTRFTEPTPTRGQAPSHSPPDTRYAPGITLARRLGWFSIGLGLAEVLAPRALADLSGVPCPGTIRAFGVREIVNGVGVLNSPRPVGWMWGRVGGDALDLMTAACALARADAGGRSRVLGTLAALAGVSALDILCSTQLSAAAALEG